MPDLQNNLALDAHVRSVSDEYLVALERFHIWSLVHHRWDDVSRCHGHRFIQRIAILGVNELLLAIARAFDTDTRCASVPNGLAEFESAVSQCRLVVLRPHSFDRVKERHGVAGPGELGRKLRDLVQAAQEPLAKLTHSRNKFLAHNDLGGHSRQIVDEDEAQLLLGVMASFLSAMTPFYSGVSFFERGEFDLGYWDEAITSLREWIDFTSRPWARALPEGYELDEPTPGVWQPALSGRPRKDAPPFASGDPASAVIAAWLHAAGRRDLFWWNERGAARAGSNAVVDLDDDE